jgi:hypothetical protein
MRILRGILRRRGRNGVLAKAFPIEVSRTEPGRTVTLYQVLQMWQLDGAVLFICFVLVSVEALAFGRSILPNTW